MTFDPSTYVPLPRVSNTVQEVRDKEWLQARIDERMSHNDIGVMLGCSQTVVSTWVRRLGVDTPGPGWHLACTNPLLHDVVWLRRNYVDIGRTVVSMATEVGCGQNAMRAALKEYGIGLRGYRTEQEITVPEWHDYDRRRFGVLSKDVICLYVAEAYNVRVDSIDFVKGHSFQSRKGQGANGRVWHARRVAVWLCRSLLGWSVKDVVAGFGFTAPSGVYRSFQRIDTYVKSCPAYAAEVQGIASNIAARS